MAANTLEGKRESIVTEYILRILGLDVSARQQPGTCYFARLNFAAMRLCMHAGPPAAQLLSYVSSYCLVWSCSLTMETVL